MAGNVWDWTDDWYASRHPEAARFVLRAAQSRAVATSRPVTTPTSRSFRSRERSIKGGSFLCADSYCMRYRPAARRPQMIDTGMSHIGFRCVKRDAPR